MRQAWLDSLACWWVNRSKTWKQAKTRQRTYVAIFGSGLDQRAKPISYICYPIFTLMATRKCPHWLWLANRRWLHFRHRIGLHKRYCELCLWK